MEENPPVTSDSSHGTEEAMGMGICLSVEERVRSEDNGRAHALCMARSTDRICKK